VKDSKILPVVINDEIELEIDHDRDKEIKEEKPPHHN
jgi:hypothetical protein